MCDRPPGLSLSAFRPAKSHENLSLCGAANPGCSRVLGGFLRPRESRRGNRQRVFRPCRQPTRAAPGRRSSPSTNDDVSRRGISVLTSQSIMLSIERLRRPKVKRLAYEMHADGIALARRHMRPLLTNPDYLNLEEGRGALRAVRQELRLQLCKPMGKVTNRRQSYGLGPHVCNPCFAKFGAF
jgi:hypothetical protein